MAVGEPRFLQKQSHLFHVSEPFAVADVAGHRLEVQKVIGILAKNHLRTVSTTQNYQHVIIIARRNLSPRNIPPSMSTTD